MPFPENSELDEESEDDGGEEETLPDTPFSAEASAGCRTPFKVDPCIDLKSHALLDMISTGPDLEEAAAQPSVSISVKPNDQISVAEAFDSW